MLHKCDMKTPKRLQNPALREKFKIGDRVFIPREIADRFVKMIVTPNGTKFFGNIASLFDRQIGKHYRFAIDVAFDSEYALRRPVEIWEEWMMERIVIVPLPSLAGRLANQLTSELDAVKQLQKAGMPLSKTAKRILEDSANEL